MAGRAKPRIGPLCTLAGVRKELGRVYKEARRGELSIEELRGFTYSLTALRDLVVAGEIEGRLELLERDNGSP